MNETPVQQRVRVRASELNVTLWRNNSGACYDDTGRLIRYGLANDSKEMNAVIKSSDLIGITPLVITPDMVGQTIGVFTAIETKASDWTRQPGDKRAEAQAKFHDIVQRNGGFAGFASSPNDVATITRRQGG